MSLKQRAVRCSGHIPADQYVPVYSRPHRTNQVRWHEEIAPVMPKPTLDDLYNTRTRSIHEAVKQWLESSPNSVIGPLYRSRSPSSGSPPSNGGSLEKTPARAETAPWEPNMERFYDVGSGGLSPVKQVSRRQVSIEQSNALITGSSTSSRPADDSSTPWENTYTNRAQDAVRAAALLPTQNSGVKSPERVLSQGNDGESRKAKDATLSSMPQESSAVNEVSSSEEEASAQAEEGTNIISSGRRGGKKRNISELESPDQDRSSGQSGGSTSGFTSRAGSREFDNELALAVKDIEKLNAVDTLSSPTANSSFGEPIVLLKPPRGLEGITLQSSEQNLTVAKLPLLPRAASARDDHNSAAMRLPPPLPWAASAREDQNIVLRRVLSPHLPADTENRSGMVDVSKAGSNSEIVPVGDPEIVEHGSSDKENISDSKQKALIEKQLGFGATLKKIDEARLESCSKKETSDAPPLTIKAVLQHEEKLAAQSGKTRSRNVPIISNGVASFPGGRYEFRNERSSRRMQSSYSSGGSVASAANSVPSQYIYKVSPPHQMARKAHRSKKQSTNSVAPLESQQLKTDKSTQSSKSKERESSPRTAKLDKAKLEELRVKAEAWENAKNATIMNRYKREESKIYAWEERNVAKATMSMSKLESDLEKKRAKAMEKMQYEVAQAHKKAAEMRARAEAKRAERAAKAAMQAQVIRVLGKTPLSCFCS